MIGPSAWLGELPYDIREKLDSYLESVRAASSEVLSEANLPDTRRNRDALLMAASVRWIWRSVDGQEWLVGNALRTLNSSAEDTWSTNGFQVGSAHFSRSSSDYGDLVELKRAMSKFLLRNGVSQVADAPTLSAAVAVLLGRAR